MGGASRTCAARLRAFAACSAPSLEPPAVHRLRGVSPIEIERPSLRDAITLNRLCACWNVGPMQRPGLLLRALTPPAYSYACETRRGLAPGSLSNRRLEFLGDKVATAAVAIGMRALEGTGEDPKVFGGGWGSDMVSVAERVSAAVENGSLEAEGRSLGLDSVIRGGVNDERAGRLVADVFEAVCGALYMEGGLERVQGVVRGLVRGKKVEDVRELERETGLWAETKGGGFKVVRLGERAHRIRASGGRNGVTLVISVEEEAGLDTHQAHFTCVVDGIIFPGNKLGGKVQRFRIGRATRKNKNEAEHAAAANATKSLRGEPGGESVNALGFLQDTGWLGHIGKSSDWRATDDDEETANELLRNARKIKVVRQEERKRSRDHRILSLHDPNLELAASELRMRSVYEKLSRYLVCAPSKLVRDDVEPQIRREITRGNSLAWRRYIGRCLRRLWAAEHGYMMTSTLHLANSIYVNLLQVPLITATDSQWRQWIKSVYNTEGWICRRENIEHELLGWLWENNGWTWTRDFLGRTLKLSDSVHEKAFQ